MADGDEVVARLHAWIEARRRTDGTPTIVGLQGIQGCGKTTACRELARRMGDSCVALSIDDFYKPARELEAVARAHPRESRLQGRGNPGTHDIHLLLRALEALRNGAPAVDVPTFDKTLRDGLGDRAAKPRTLRAPDVVIVEGWCVGFVPLGVADDFLDARVAEYAQLHTHLDGMAVLHADPAHAYAWREAAERAQGNGLSGEQVRAMVDRFMPTYRAYVPKMLRRWHGEALILTLETPIRLTGAERTRHPRAETDETCRAK